MFEFESTAPSKMGFEWASQVGVCLPGSVLRRAFLSACSTVVFTHPAPPCTPLPRPSPPPSLPPAPLCTPLIQLRCAQDGFIATFPAVASQFTAARNASPVRVVVLGPPGSGKTAVSTALGQHLYLPVVRVGDAVNLALGRAAPGVVDSIGPVRWPEGLRERVGETMVAPTSRLPTKLLARVVHTVLTTPKLRNRG